jgi:hypothetical protein
MEDKEILTDEQLWQLCIEEENKKKIIHHDRNEDKAIDYEFWGLMYDRSKDLK